MAQQVTVLAVDDERPLAAVVASYVEKEGFRAIEAFDGPCMLVQVEQSRPDLVISEVMLPGIDGIEVCRRIRQFSDACILKLTALDEELDKVMGLSVSADDYLVKPFSPRELVPRVRATLRRPRGDGPEASVVRFGDLEGDDRSRRVTRLLRRRGVNPCFEIEASCYPGNT